MTEPSITSDCLEQISDFIFTNKYARYRDDLKRRETWDEAVTRLQMMHLKKYSFLPQEDLDKIVKAFNLVREKRIAPSFRSLQFGGKAIEQQNSRGFNCLGVETEFITKEGVRSFEDFEDGDTTIVLTHKGNWKNAVVRNFGKGRLYDITINKGKHTIQKVRATKNHRWILRNDQEFTEDIKIGDSLYDCPDVFSKFNYESAPIDEKLYWCYGLVYGDGTKVKGKHGVYKGSMIRLCDHQSRFAERFRELGFGTSLPLSCKGDFMAYTGKYMKTPPDPTIDDPRLIRAFVKGYLDADGSRNTNFSLDQLDHSEKGNLYQCIQASDVEHIEFIRNCFPIAGVYILSEEDLTGKITNYGIRPTTSKFRICQCGVQQAHYKVKNISESFVEEDVWCLVVEDDESFVFPNGLTTGNCAVRHVDSIRSFSEIFHLLLCGCGVGIGVSNYFLQRLPNLVDENDKTGTVLTYVIEDTIDGWADSVEALLQCYFKNTAFTGRKIVFDFSKIRKKGSPLKTSGGKAPGYQGLKQALIKIKKLLDHIIEYRKQSELRSIDVYDILMHCADAVLSGGIRRSATIVVFDKDDEDMLTAKTLVTVDRVFSFDKDGTKVLAGVTTQLYEGKVSYEGVKYDVIVEEWELEELQNNKQINWWHLYPQRARSNNSVLLVRSELSKEEFISIIERTKQFGEPGFVLADHPWVLCNPCAEILFLPVTEDGICGVQFCNLTTINGRLATSFEIMKENVEAYTIIGTLQAGYTAFPYYSKACKQLTEEEALLGCSITGVMDNPNILTNPEYQTALAEYAIEVNKEWAEKIGINQAARITTLKPEGTSSLVFGTASGIHPHHAHQYFRRVQCNKEDNVYKHFKKTNPHMCEESVWSANNTDDVITFLVEVPTNAVVKNDLSAIEHLEIIKSTQKHWVIPGTTPANKKPVVNNVSCTVIVDEHEWEEVIDYIYENKQFFTAVSFIPRSGDKIYPQAPMEAVTTPEDEIRWNYIKDNMNRVDYTTLKESDDKTNLQVEFACAGGNCELV